MPDYDYGPGPDVRGQVHDVVIKLFNTRQITEQEKMIASKYAQDLLTIKPAGYSLRGWCTFGIEEYVDMVKPLIDKYREQQRTNQTFLMGSSQLVTPCGLSKLTDQGIHHASMLRHNILKKAGM